MESQSTLGRYTNDTKGMTDFYDRSVDDALTRAELDNLKPPTEEMFLNTYRSTVWYNESVWTAASIFVQAANEDDKFRKDFMSEETVEVEVFPNEDGSTTTVDSDKWRQTLQEELPEYHEEVMGIGLSAFQGGNAEQVARRYLERNG